MIPHPIPEILSAYLDGEATAEERQQVESHLATCPVCRQHLEALKQTVALVHALEPVSAPEGFRPGVRARLQVRSALDGLLHWRWRPSWRILASATAVALVGMFSLNLFHQLLPQQEVREEPNLERGVAGITPAGITPPQDAAETKSTNIVARRPVPQGTALAPSGRQVIRTSTMTIEVRDVDEAATALLRIAESSGGFIANSTIVRRRPSYGTFELRIPVARFGLVLDQVESVGDVRERHLTGQDVTEDFVDLQARVRNLERHEHQLLTFMDRAAKVADLLAIEQELARVRGEIEQLTGRLRFMNNRIELATVDVTLREAQRSTPGFWNFPASLDRIQAAFVNTVRQLLVVVERLAILTSAFLPLALIALPGWMLVRRISRRRIRLGDEQSGQ